MCFRLLLLALGLPLTVGAGEWSKVSSPHFELFTTAGEKKGREAVLYFEQVNDLFQRMSAVKRNQTGRVRIVAFSSPKEYQPFSPGEGFSAFYLNAGERDYIVMSSIREENYPTAVHEYTHLWIKEADVKVPDWLNEGLAEVHSTLKPAGDKVQLGHPLAGRLQMLQSAKWIPLSRLVEIDRHSPEYNEKNRTGMFYSESWLLTHMLYLSADYRPKWKEFLNSLLETQSAETAFRTVYGKSMAEMEKDLKAYSRSDRMNFLVLDARMEKPSEAPEVSPATAYESGMVLADLYGAVGKPADAEKLYSELARDNPDRWEVEEGRGLAAWRNRDLAAAKEHYSRAFDLKATNASMLLDYAKMLQGGDAERSIAVLERVVELDPQLRDAHLMLGDLLYRKQDYRGAAEQFAAVRETTPDRAFALLTMLAYAQFQSGSKESARANAEKARKFARTPEDVHSLDELMKFMNSGKGGSASEDAGEPTAPALQRREQTEPRAAEPAQPSERAEGTFLELECLPSGAKIVILVGGRKTGFLIKDPTKVVIRSATPEGGLQFACGPQKPRLLTVEYLPGEDDKTGTNGVVRALEFAAE
jgi:Flp pilus assembly protein TadD